MSLKNVRYLNIDENLFCIYLVNKHEQKVIQKDIDSTFLQFHFVLEGGIDFIFNEGMYKLSIEQDNYLTLYNPIKKLPVNISSNQNSTFISIFIAIESFHNLFSNDTKNISFLDKENINQKYYNQNNISLKMNAVLHEMISPSLNANPNNNLFLKAKVYELFSLIFQSNDDNNEKCPYIMSDDHLRKVKLAKEIILKRYSNPPTLVDLAQEIKLSLKKLKQGFKEVYGAPVFQYLLEYKMDLAKKMLSSGKYNVNEVSINLGYSTASHFIAAFKRRYNITPKQFTLNQ
tara:strand:- start:2630 stop:3493 length:864 start_codon:yes stop_codon:yes gene_type:complete